MILLRNCTVAIVALLLAMQGVNAVAMPLCVHGATNSTSPASTQKIAGMAHAHHHHGHDIDDDAGRLKLIPEVNDANSLACDDCEICSLSSASTLRSAELVGAAGPRQSARPSNETLPIGVTPHQLSKPPVFA